MELLSRGYWASLRRWPGGRSRNANSSLCVPKSTENWILCRQSTLLGDDDGSRQTGSSDVGNTGDYYMSGDAQGDPNSAPSVFYNGTDGLRFQPSLINSRVDIAATERDTLRQEVCYFWNDQSDWDFGGGSNQGGDADYFESPTDLVKTNQVLDAMYYGYPRGELRAHQHAAPGHDADQCGAGPEHLRLPGRMDLGRWCRS